MAVPPNSSPPRLGKFCCALVFALLAIGLASLTLNAQSTPRAQAALAKTPTATKKPRLTRTPTLKPTRTPTPAESTFTPTATETTAADRTNTPAVTATFAATETESATPTVPTPVPTDSGTPILTDTPTETPGVSDTPQVSDTPAVTDTPQTSDTPAVTDTPTDTPEPSETPDLSETPTLTATSTLTDTPEATAVVTETPTSSVTPTPTDDLFAAAVTPSALNSTFLVANLDTTTASATLRVFDLNGATVYSTTRSIAPNGARAIAMPATVPDGFVGSATVSSKQKISAIVLNANLNNTAREMYEAGSTNANALDFALYRHLGSPAQKSVIAIQNTDPLVSASVYFHYYNPDGSEAAGSPLTPVTIAPHAAYAFDSQTLFGSFVVTYSVHITGTTAIAGAERFTYLRDTAAAAGVDRTQLGKRFFLNQVERQVSDGNAQSWSQIFVRNTGTLSTNVTIRYFDHDGTLRTTESRAVNPQGMVQFDTRAKNKLGEVFHGYAILKQTGNQPLAVQWLDADAQGRELSASNGLPAGRAAGQWACVDARHLLRTLQSTQFQVLNPGKKALVVTLSLYDDASGKLQTSQSYKFDPKQRRVLDLSHDPFSVLGAQYRGLAILRASKGGKVVVNALDPYGSRSESSYGCMSMPR